MTLYEQRMIGLIGSWLTTRKLARRLLPMLTVDRRRVDVLTFNYLTTARGLVEMDGFELKASRRDWQIESATPEKAIDVARFCDRWWVVAYEDGIVEPSELPAGHGLLVARNQQDSAFGARALFTVVDAKPRTPVQPSRALLASLLTRVAAPSWSAIDAATRAAWFAGWQAREAEFLRGAPISDFGSDETACKAFPNALNTEIDAVVAQRQGAALPPFDAADRALLAAALRAALDRLGE